MINGERPITVDRFNARACAESRPLNLFVVKANLPDDREQGELGGKQIVVNPAKMLERLVVHSPSPKSHTQIVDEPARGVIHGHAAEQLAGAS